MTLLGAIAVVAIILGTLCAIAVFAIPRKFYPCKKKQLQCAEKKKDIISQLPDDILISILELGTTKSAVTTSMLSKRWRYLHTSLSNIELNCSYLLGPYYSDGYREPHDSNIIINSLHRFLSLRSGSSKIHSFRLTCCLTNSVTEPFEQCICFIGRSGVEKLDLACFCKWLLDSCNFSFSCHLLSAMPSLKQFKLSFCYLQPSLRFQSNSLQILFLHQVKVCPGAIECILSSCLTLHFLQIRSCRCPSKLSFCGPRLELKSLFIWNCENIEEIEFYASNLVLFEFFEKQVPNFKFNHVPKMQRFYLHNSQKNIMPYVFGKLSEDLPHLISLDVRSKVDIQYLNTQWSSRYTRMNRFDNLRRLNVHLCPRPNINLILLTPLLRSCPLLQEFHLNLNSSKFHAPLGKMQDVIFHPHLKKVEINGFRGMESEVEFALFILKSAICLEKMYICRCFKIFMGCRMWRVYDTPRWSEETHKMIQKRLQGQAVSKNAQVVIQYNVQEKY